jgi:pyrimidine deaminase RibD-like protein
MTFLFLFILSTSTVVTMSESGLLQFFSLALYLLNLHPAEHLHFLRLALEEAKKCDPTPTAFCVGCILVARCPPTFNPVVITTGHSRELPGNTHAEANALSKAYNLSAVELSALLAVSSVGLDEILPHIDVYTTMEPCSIRTSGLPPCTDALVAANVKRCFIGVGEPADFVICEGAQKLEKAGIEVIWVKGIEEECLQVARGYRGV